MPKLASYQTFLEELNALARRVAQVASYPAGGLASGERAVMEILDLHGPQTVPQMARSRHTSRQNIQILVNRLKADGCVELASNPAHRRSWVVIATQKGKDLLRSAGNTASVALQLFAARVPEPEAVAATAVLARVRQLLGTPEKRTIALIKRRGKHQTVEPVEAALPQQASFQENEFPVNLL